MAFGVTEEGFVLKRLPDILQESREAAASIFGDLVPPGDVVDTTDSSALGRLINLDSEGDSELWEAMQEVYSAFDPNTATGIALDNLVAYGGLFRFDESFSIVALILKGDFNTNIASGSFVESPSTSNRFATNSDVTLDLEGAIGLDVTINTVTNSTLYTITYTSAAAGTDVVEYTSDSNATETEILNGLKAEVDSNHPRLTASIDNSTLVVTVTDSFQLTDFSLSSELTVTKVSKLVNGTATVAGPLEAPAGTVTQIVTPISGWDSVTNPTAASLGRLRETDEELRLRFASAKFTRGINTIDAIVSDISLVDGVTELKVYENDTDSVDANGLPAHSFYPVVVGGTQQDIADAIYLNKPAGIQSFGDITIAVLDSQGLPHDISFSRPSLIEIYVDIELTTDSDFPVGGEDLIRDEIVKYASENLGIADDVVLSRLYTPINKIEGHRVDNLQIGFSAGSLGTSDLVIGFDELADFIKGNISITVS